MYGYFKNQTVVHLHSPGEVAQMRNIFNLEVKYTPTPNIQFLMRLRPFYDAVFDITNEGLGGRDELDRYLEHNVGRLNDSDPLLREVYLDLEYRGLQATLGRQIVVWGRSDALRLLDIINPFNYRQFGVIDDDQDFRIPLWMVNLQYEFAPWHILQFLFIPKYYEEFDAPAGSIFAPAIIPFIEDLYATLRLYGAQIKSKNPPTTFDDSTYGVRWSGKFRDLTYTLNYLYTWDPIKDMVPTGVWWVPVDDPFLPSGFNSEYALKPNRLNIFGGSFDYPVVARFLGMNNMVFRGEFAYYKDDTYVNARNSKNEEKDHFNFMLGYDTYIFTDCFFSLQFAQVYLINPGRDGYGNLALGKVDHYENSWSLYMLKDWYSLLGWAAQDRLNTELTVAMTDDGGVWARPVFTYKFTEEFIWALGVNLFWGHSNDLWGEFRDSDNMYFELKYTF